MKKILIIDGNGLIHRGFHAIPDLTSPDGRLVNAVYGFFSVFLRAFNDVSPTHVCATFDLPGPTFRHESFKEYKAHREKAPDQLYEQIPITKELLNVFKIPIYEMQGFEADDVIATIAAQTEELESVIVSGDLDTLQMVDDNTKVYTLRGSVRDTIIYDENLVFERYGFSPTLLADYRGLKGDPSDNISGVKGVGEKTATHLLINYGKLEKIYEAVEKDDPDIKERVKKLLLDGKDNAFFSRELAQVKTDVPIEFNLGDTNLKRYDKEAVMSAFEKFGFYSLLDRLPGNNKEQGSLI